MKRAANLDLLFVLPTLVTGYLFGVLQLAGGDDRVSAWFFDPQRSAFPLQHDFWLRDVIHDGGRTLMITILIGVAVTWLLSRTTRMLRPLHPLAGYLLVAMLLGVGLVSLGKQITNTDCPWDLSRYGGTRPHLLLFEAKPAELPRGRCFPGGHSSSGFALFGLYFAAVMRGRRRAWPWLLPGLLIGSVFSVAQWMRGAHFPSHDLISAWLCWNAALVSHWLATRPSSSRNGVGAPPPGSPPGTSQESPQRRITAPARQPMA